MKYQLILPWVLIAASCGSNNPADKATTARIDSLSRQIQEIKEQHKPGLGEIMSVIQMHHAKLWFAGTNSNWKLSAYEIGEIREMLESAKALERDRPEIKNLPLIFPAVDSVAASIQQQNLTAFKNSYLLLTNTCNACHRVSNFEFNKIILPTAPPVTNQDFKAR